MKENISCYGCDYFYPVEDLTDYVDSQFPEGIKLCEECVLKGEGK